MELNHRLLHVTQVSSPLDHGTDLNYRLRSFFLAHRSAELS